MKEQACLFGAQYKKVRRIKFIGPSVNIKTVIS